MVQDDSEEVETQGLPDAAVYDEDGWAVLFESKVQASVSLSQVERHRNTAKRHGFESPWIVVISVDKLSCELSAKTIATTWQDVYAWFNRRAGQSSWARYLVSYMQVFERKMLQQEYQIRGTITVFDGLRFDEDNPYSYREGKRLIRLLGDLLQQRKDLRAIGVDSSGKRRPAITGKGMDSVWDFIPLKAAREAKQFTSFPHLTMSIDRSEAKAAITVPNGVKGGFKSKLASVGFDGFIELLSDLEKRARPIMRGSAGAKPMIYIVQRHFRSQRSVAVKDAILEADLRTGSKARRSGVQYQPQWLEAIYELLVHKQSNIQLGVEMRFRYSCPQVRSGKAVDLFADSWKAFSPLVDFVLKD